MVPLPQKRCAFCDRTLSLHEILGRWVCSSCWDIIATIALKAVSNAIIGFVPGAVVNNMNEAIGRIGREE